MLKVFGIIIGAILALLLIVIIYLNFFFSLDSYKDEIANAIEEQTGMLATFNGKLGLKVFPGISIDVNMLELKNPEGQEPFSVELDHASLSLAITPLLQKQLKIEEASIGGASIILTVDENDPTNLKSIEYKTNSSITAPQQEVGNSKDLSIEQPHPMEQLFLSNTKILKMLSRFSISTLTVTDFSLLMQDTSGQQLALISVENAKLIQKEFTVNNISYELELYLQYVNSVKNITLGLEMNGALNGSTSNGSLEVSLPFNLAFSSDKAKEKLNGNLTANINSLSKSFASSINIDSNFLMVDSNVNLKRVDDNSEGSGLVTAKLNPQKLFTLLGEGLETQDNSVLKNAEIRLPFTYSEKQLIVTDGQGKLDDTSINYKLSMGTDKANPTLDTTISLTNINIDKYLPPANSSAKPAATANSAKPTEKSVPNSEVAIIEKDSTLARLNAKFILTIDQLIANKIIFNSVNASGKIENGTAYLDNLSSNALGGNLKMDATADFKANPLKSSANVRATNLAIAQILALSGSSQKITGVLNSTAKVTFAGSEADAIIKTLAGNATVNITNMRLNNVLPSNIISRFTNFNLSDLMINRVVANFIIKNEVVTNTSLNADANRLAATGSGTFNMKSMYLNYKLRAVAEKSIVIPLNITGPTSNISVSVDEAELAKATMEGFAGAVGKSIIKNQAVDDAAKDVGKLFKGVGSILKR